MARSDGLKFMVSGEGDYVLICVEGRGLGWHVKERHSSHLFGGTAHTINGGKRSFFDVLEGRLRTLPALIHPIHSLPRPRKQSFRLD
jgi:hypothetical protein